MDDSQQEATKKKGLAAKKAAASKSKKRSPEADVVGLAENLATYTGENPDEKPPAKKKAKTDASTKPAASGGGSEFCSEGVPTETLPDGLTWSEGWTRKVYKRMGGKTAGTKDAYWFSPKTNLKLRSIPEVVRFMKALKACNNDENEARKKWKEPQFAPPKPAPKKPKTSTTAKTTTAKASKKDDESTKKDGGDGGGDDNDGTKPPPTAVV